MTRIPAYRAYNTRLHVMQPVLAIDLDPETGGVEVWDTSRQNPITGEYEDENDIWTWEEIALMERVPLAIHAQNGTTDLYESDVVVHPITGMRGVVIWQAVGLAFMVQSLNSPSLWMIHDDWQALGNIWQHAGLLVGYERETSVSHRDRAATHTFLGLPSSEGETHP